MDIKTDHEFDFPAATVWHHIGTRFGDLADWSASLAASSLEGELGEGAVRHCDARASWPFPSGRVSERLLQFAPAEMYLVYEAFEGLPSFMTAALNRWRVVPLSALRCRIDMHATVQLSGVARLGGPLMGPVLQRMGRKTLIDLDRFLQSPGAGLTQASEVEAR